MRHAWRSCGCANLSQIDALVVGEIALFNGRPQPIIKELNLRPVSQFLQGHGRFILDPTTPTLATALPFAGEVGIDGGGAVENIEMAESIDHLAKYLCFGATC